MNVTITGILIVLKVEFAIDGATDTTKNTITMAIA